MALFEITRDEGIAAFRQLQGGPDLYESEIEGLLWENLQELTGQVLLPVRRQAPISGGGRPDIVALDRTGGVVVVEVKRAVERSQLAQCLEYAGWARTTHLDEVAGLYHRGPDAFWGDWKQFTGTEQPVRINGHPSLIIVAKSFDVRTASAVEYLQENDVPITVLRVRLYEDAGGRRYLDADIDGSQSEPEQFAASAAGPQQPTQRTFYGVSVADLIGGGLLTSGEELTWHRQGGETHTCTIEADGRLRAPNGKVASSLSGVATAIVGGGSFDGWEIWKAEQRGGQTMKELRQRYLDDQAKADDADAPEPEAQ